ncbi:MAG TPA: hypothetical protein DEG71_05720 [Clostridiales bacterium]|nr:hypothetical protein [Clostridiales bacterium]
MLKYKDTYFVVKQKDSTGKPSINKDDNYIRCKRGVQIYRYNSSTLAIQFNTNGYAKNRLKELSDIGIQFTSLQRGDDEQTYTFSESDLSEVADIVKAKKRIKRDLTDEQRNVLRERMKSLSKNNK